MRHKLLLLIASALLWSAAPVWSAPLDQTLAYQKTLTAAPPVVSTTASVTFNFYDSATGGSLIWSESKSMNLLSTTRLISTKLGDSHVLNLADFADKQLWVETVVGSSVVGTRDKLAPTPYALWSANAAVTDNSITGAKLATMGASSGQALVYNGSSWAPASVGGGSVTSVTGTAANVTGVVAVANGGTGATTQTGAANAILPSQSGNSGKLLTTDGTNSSWLASAATKVPVTASLTATTKTITNTYGEYTGSSITLGPGKWNVQISMLLPDDCNCDMWVRSTLSDSTTNAGSSADVIGATTASGLHFASKFATLNGSIIVNNTSAASKTYYYWAANIATYNSCTYKLTNFATTAWGENQMIAFPMNQ